jgi:hypothetical protein
MSSCGIETLRACHKFKFIAFTLTRIFWQTFWDYSIVFWNLSRRVETKILHGYSLCFSSLFKLHMFLHILLLVEFRDRKILCPPGNFRWKWGNCLAATLVLFPRRDNIILSFSNWTDYVNLRVFFKCSCGCFLKYFLFENISK